MLFGRLGNSAILGVLSAADRRTAGDRTGYLAAIRPGGLLDRCISGFAVGAYAMPEYVTGLLAILVFSIWLYVLPGTSLIDPNDNPLEHSAGSCPAGRRARVQHARLHQPGHAGKHDPGARQPLRPHSDPEGHALSHGHPEARAAEHTAADVTEIGMNFGYVIGGLVVVETLFSYAGLGQLITSAVSFRDIPIIEAGVLVVAAAYGVGNLVADIAALLLNPRLRT